MKRTFLSVSVINGEIEISPLSHFVLHDDLLLQIPHRDARAIERDPRGLLLRLEPVEHVRGHG